MKDKDLRTALCAYAVKEPSDSGLKNTKELIMAQRIPKNVPIFYPVRFLLGQVRFLRPSFWVLTAAYLCVTAALNLTTKPPAVISLCTLTPFLTVAAAPTLFYNRHPQSFELESSCLYTPKTVLAGKLTLCGAFDILAVVLCSALCALLGGIKFELSLLLGLLSFTSSSLITLTACVFTKVQSGLVFCFGIFCLFFGLVAGNADAQTALAAVSPLLLLALLLLCAALLFPLVKTILKKSEYERLESVYDN